MLAAVQAPASVRFVRAAADRAVAVPDFVVIDLMSTVLGTSGPSWQDPDKTSGRHHGMPVPRRPVSFFERRFLQQWRWKDLRQGSPSRRSTRYSSALSGAFQPPNRSVWHNAAENACILHCSSSGSAFLSDVSGA